jgi:hypothetical protein
LSNRKKPWPSTAFFDINKGTTAKGVGKLTMKKTHGVIGLVAICLVVLALSAWGIASFTRLGLDLDGLLLILSSLLMGLLFLVALVSIAREEGWLPQRHKKETAAAPAAKPAAPRAAPVKPAAEEVVSTRGEGK